MYTMRLDCTSTLYTFSYTVSTNQSPGCGPLPLRDKVLQQESGEAREGHPAGFVGSSGGGFVGARALGPRLRQAPCPALALGMRNRGLL